MSRKADIAAVRRALHLVPAGPDLVEAQLAFARLEVELAQLPERPRSDEKTKKEPDAAR